MKKLGVPAVVKRPAVDYSPLWYWVREREREKIRAAKERGAAFPWTNDHILEGEPRALYVPGRGA